MAATRIIPIAPLGPNADENAVVQLTISGSTAIDITNGNVVSLETNLLIVFENTAAADGTVTVTGVADAQGRYNTGLVAYTIDGTGTSANNTVSRTFTASGWADAARDLNITASAVTIVATAYKI